MLRPLRLVLALALATGLAGCETFEKMNPFAEKETPLAGTRQPVFPEGVPGVSYSAPPTQPSNANVVIQPSGSGQQGTVTAPVGRN